MDKQQQPEKAGVWVWVKRMGILMVLIGSVAATAASALNYFAHAEEVRKTNAQQDAQQELSESRLALSISQDNVDRGDANVRWMKQQAVFKRKTDPPSPAEHDMIEAAERELAQQRARHTERIKRFEQKYEQAF